MDLHITKIKLNNVHIINEFSKHTIFTLHPYRSLKQQDCSLRLVCSLIVLLLVKAASRPSDGDEGGFKDGKSYLCPQHSHDDDVCLILVLLLGDLFGQKFDEQSHSSKNMRFCQYLTYTHTTALLNCIKHLSFVPHTVSLSSFSAYQT